MKLSLQNPVLRPSFLIIFYNVPHLVLQNFQTLSCSWIAVVPPRAGYSVLVCRFGWSVAGRQGGRGHICSWCEREWFCFSYNRDVFSSFIESQMQRHFPFGRISWRCRLAECKFQISNISKCLPTLSTQIVPVKPVELDHRLVACPVRKCLLHWWPQLPST